LLISIIIPFYDNDYDKIPNIINELNKLTFSKEVIFVDDRNDKTEDISIPSQYKLVRSHELFDNVGTFEARRSGVLNAVGDYIWFIDIDDKLCDIVRFPTIDEDISAYEYCYDFGDKIINTYVFRYFGFEGMYIRDVHNIKSVMSWTNLGLWNKLFKRKTVLKTFESIPFLNKFIRNEDGYLYFEILKNSKLVTFKLEHIYIYTNPNKHEAYMKELKSRNKLNEYIEDQIPINTPDRKEYIKYLKRIS
jgi:hypothetical protein